jgi:two-component system sensor histidine kinase UhpB
MSLRLRLNILVAVLNLGFLAALSWLQFDSYRNSIEEEIVAAHRVTVQMLATAVQTSRLFGSSPAVMIGYLESLGRIRANDIRLYTADGELRYSSPQSLYKAGRSAPAWFDSMMRPTLNATVIGVVGAARIEIVPDASRAILDAWDDMTAIFLLGLGFFVALHTALLLFLRRLLRPTENDAQRLVATTQALAENREVMLLIQAGIEDERKRLSRELHDELGQSVTAIQLIAKSIARRGEQPGEVQSAEKINEIAAGLYDSVHRIVRELRPAVLEQPDLANALTDLAGEWRLRHADIELALELEGDLGVKVTVINRDGRWEAAIEDNGGGTDESISSAGHGLVGMRERIVALGGSLEVARLPAGGFCVRIALPLPRDCL